MMIIGDISLLLSHFRLETSHKTNLPTFGIELPAAKLNKVYKLFIFNKVYFLNFTSCKI